MEFWIERLANRMGMKYWQFSLFVPLLIVVGHFVIAIFTEGLARFEHDAGLLLLILGWFLVLTAIKRYSESFKRLTKILPQITDFKVEELATNWDMIFGKRMYAAGFFGVALATLNFWTVMWPFYTSGWTELPFHGSVQFGMRYTSLPAILWASTFWSLFDFIAGGIFWMCVANVLLMRLISKESRLTVNLYDSSQLSKLKIIGKTAFNAILMPAAGLVFTPAALTAPMTLSQNLWRVFLWGYFLYTLFLATIFSLSVYYIHLALDRRKREYLDHIKKKLLEIHNSIWSRPNQFVSDVDYHQLFWLQNAKSVIGEVSTWPFDSEITYRVAALVLSPSLAALLQYVLSLVLQSRS